MEQKDTYDPDSMYCIYKALDEGFRGRRAGSRKARKLSPTPREREKKKKREIDLKKGRRINIKLGLVEGAIIRPFLKNRKFSLFNVCITLNNGEISIVYL